MKNVEIRRMGLLELVELKKSKEATLWNLGFRLASKELFDILSQIDLEIDLRLDQIKELRKMSTLELLPNITESDIVEIESLIEQKDFQYWIND